MYKTFLYFYSLIALLLLSSKGNAQYENTKWYFGNMAGLNFMTTPPTAITNGVMNSTEGCASIADGAGNLLFYTEGATIWNQANVPMANGTGLNGNSSTTQAAVIIRQPGSGSLYYVFTLSSGSNCILKYSIVDMTLAAGMGSVTAKNIPLVISGLTERLTATRHCNGTDFWILVHQFNSNSFLAFQLTSGGVITSPVTSSIGSSITGGAWVGCMKISPDGKKLADALYAANGTVELFDFDNSTGVLSNSLSLITLNSNYGVEFSADCSKLYSTQWGIVPIHQWDLCAGSSAAVVASHYLLNTSIGPKGTLQLGPDGKIYATRSAQTSLGVINSPNLAGAACNYVETGQSIAPKVSNSGLPNFISFYRPPPVPFTYTVSGLFGCQSAGFAVPPAPNATLAGCSTLGYSFTGALWNFGDPSSGTNNTSSQLNPVHFFTNIGTYNVQLILYYSCGGGTDTLNQVVNITQPCISVSSTSITCATLGSATVTMPGGVGPYSYTWMPTGQTSSVASGLSPGIYTITVLDLSSNFTFTATTVFTSLIPLTGSINNSSSITCNGAFTGTANVTGIAGGSGTQNYLWSNGINTYTLPNPVSLPAGNWTVTVTDALTGCTINGGFNISQPPALTLTVSASTPTACAGNSIVLTGTNSGGSPMAVSPGYNYAWAAGPSAANYTVSQSAGGSYIYTLSSSDANNCAASETISVGFVNNPTLSISNFSICPLAIGTLTVTGATSYAWSNGANTATLTDNPLSTTRYTVVGSALACTTAATASIILKPAPVPTLNTNSPLCNGSKLLLNGSGGSSYNWSGPSAFSSAIKNPTINPAGLINAGVYNLTVTAANGCTALANSTVVVNPTPTLSALGNTVCTSQTMSLSGNSIAGASYAWSGPLSFTSALQNISINSPSVNQSGTYTLLVTSVYGCTNTATASVNIVVPPAPAISLSNGSLCASGLSGSPDNVTLSFTGASNYTLSTPGSIYNTNPSGPTSQLGAQPPYLITGPVTATLFGSNGVCTVSTTAAFTIVPNPTVAINSPNPVICSGQSYTYTSSGADSYTWSGNSNTTGSIVVASPTVNSIFSVTGSSLGCNSALQSSNIIVNPLPEVLIDPLVMVCKGSQVKLTAAGSSTSYSWSPNLFLSANTGAIVYAGPPSLQNYIIVGSLNSCTTAAVITVSVLPLPTASITAGAQSLCVNDDIVLLGNGTPMPIVAYYWNGPMSYYATGQAVRFKAVSTSYAGIYTLTVSGPNNCLGSATQSITVYELPQGYFRTENLKGCVPFCADLNFEPTQGSDIISNISWQANGYGFTGSNFKTCFSTAGNYKITGLLGNVNNCINTVTAMVNVYPKPEADFSFYPQTPVENLDEVKFTNTSRGDQLKQWSWHFSNNNGYVTGSTNPAYIFPDAGTYPIALVTSNTWGCTDSIVKPITIIEDFAIYMPAAFTPNADGINDLFGPVIRGARSSFSLNIFNRWGTRIFETTDSKAWDGSFNGEACQEGSYVWRLKVSSGSREQSINGQVLLYR